MTRVNLSLAADASTPVSEVGVVFTDYFIIDYAMFSQHFWLATLYVIIAEIYEDCSFGCGGSCWCRARRR